MFLSGGIIYIRLTSLEARCGRRRWSGTFLAAYSHTHTRMHTNLITGRTAACCGTAATVCVWDSATNLRRTAAKVMTLLRVFVWRNETKHGGKREASTTAPPIKTQRRRRRRRSALVLSRWSTKIPRNSSLSSLNLSEKQTNKKKSQTNNPCVGLRLGLFFWPLQASVTCCVLKLGCSVLSPDC